MLPAALAYDRSGRLFIVDEGAQRVRMLSQGVVTTIAGSGDEITLRQHVKGGYQDGPARQARFNNPSGIAIAKDGSIYIGDTLNHCIRRIKDGNVTTFAGSPQRPGKSDGPRATAEFTAPHGLAFDEDDNLYVADSNVGIRKIDPSGTVTTLTPSAAESKAFVGVATWGSGTSLVVFAIDDEYHFHRFRPGQVTESWRGAEEMEGAQLGGVAGLGEHAMLVTDVRANVVREFYLPEHPYVSNAINDVVAGTALEDLGKTAGYQDGPVAQAKFFVPLGIAVRGREVAIADAGNRRIRVMPAPDPRGPIGPGSPELAPDPARYRILYVGQSGGYFGTGWSESIPGRIERQLLANQTRFGFKKPPRLSALRMDGAVLAPIDSFLETYAGDGQFDLIILSIGPDTPDPAIIRKLDAKLRSSGTKLFVFMMPMAAASVIETIVNNKRPPQNASSDYSAYEATERHAIEVLKSAGVPYYATFEDVLRFEEGDRRLPLILPNDAHPNDPGRAYMADSIVKQLAKWRPWTSK